MTQEVVLPNVNAPSRAKPGSRRTRRIAAALTVLLCILLLLCYMGVFGGNVRVVEAGRVYRSGQLTGVGIQSETARIAGHGLPDVLDKYGIRTVVNLRGESDDAGWYFAEKSICEHHGVTHIDIPLSAVKMPPPDSLSKLLDAFDHAPYPILFHCQAGADRSGMTGVLYANIYQHKSFEEAANAQLTWHYGHIRWGRAHVMDDFLALYRKTGDGLSLRDWITTRYPALYAALPADLKGPGSDTSKITAKP